MDSLSPRVFSAVKLPILNSNELDLWKMRIEQYFLMTDYSLWEVILNEDSHVPTRIIECVLQPVAPTTAEQRLARKNELKARAIEKRFGGNIETKKVQKTLLKQQFENFTGNPKGGKISGKGKIKRGKLDFKDVYFVKELQFNLFSVSQMCDKKNSVLFTDTECLVLSSDFKLPDESQVLLNMYNVNLKNIVPSGDLTCLFAKATIDESNLWHRRLSHINFKTINKLKDKQHRASYKTKPVSSVDQPLFRMHMDLFRPTFVKSLNKKSYCLVVTDDYSRFTWVFFLATKDETSPILKTFITGLENQLSLKQNGIAERKNRTIIKATRTMLADSLLPILFWAEAVNTACYVQNRVLVNKPHNKTPYELLHGRTPSIGFIRPFGSPMTILNTLDSLGKFKGKVDEGFLVGYSVNSKSFRVFNSRTRIVQETLHVNFLENKTNVAGSGPTWLFDIDSLTRTMNYQPVNAGNQTNPNASFQDKFDNNDDDVAFDGKEHDFDVKKPESEVIFSPSSSAQSKKQDDKTKKEAKGKIPTVGQNFFNSTNTFSAAGPSNVAVSPTYGKSPFIDASQLTDDPDMPELKDITYSVDENVVGAEADFNNLETCIIVSPIPTTRIHKDHPVSQTISDLSSTTQTRSMTKVVKDQGGLSQMFNDDLHTWFEDPDHPDKVYKVVKALYGLHQAPRAWYETLATYLLENGFQRGTIDQTLFIKKQKGDILLFQIYVDDIIFGATNKDLCKSFEKLMKDKFQMSSMGELTLFLGLQVKQKKDGIFISQDKYVAKILKKFGLTKGKSASTLIDTEKPLLKDPDGEDIDVHTYRSMIGSLMYLTSSRPDIMFVVCACACFQVTPKASHLHAEEPKRVYQPLKDPSWNEAMQEELLQFKMQKVWVLVDLPQGKRAIGTKWVYRNKKDKRGIMVWNKARLVAQRYTQDEGIDYEEVFAPVARIEAIRLFLAYASFMGFMVYQIDVKSAFLYGTIEE
nr:hypothetical protein [Tanacetum cinerariifolium]